MVRDFTLTFGWRGTWYVTSQVLYRFIFLFWARISPLCIDDDANNNDNEDEDEDNNIDINEDDDDEGDNEGDVNDKDDDDDDSNDNEDGDDGNDDEVHFMSSLIDGVSSADVPHH